MPKNQRPDQVMPGTIDFEKLDKILDEIQQFMDSLAHVFPELKMRIERWRWDMPEISIVWEGKDRIQRNIVALITDYEKPYELMIEVNAWYDQTTGKIKRREWEHQEIARFEPSQIGVQRQVENAYRTVSHWTRKSLTHREEVAIKPNVKAPAKVSKAQLPRVAAKTVSTSGSPRYYLVTEGKKLDLIDKVAQNTNVAPTQVGTIMNNTIKIMLAALEAGEKVNLSDFGSFEIRGISPRVETSSRTQKKVHIAAGRRAAFSAGALILDAVSGKGKKG